MNNRFVVKTGHNSWLFRVWDTKHNAWVVGTGDGYSGAFGSDVAKCQNNVKARAFNLNNGLPYGDGVLDNNYPPNHYDFRLEKPNGEIFYPNR